jgi:hypothetical protein
MYEEQIDVMASSYQRAHACAQNPTKHRIPLSVGTVDQNIVEMGGRRSILLKSTGAATEFVAHMSLLACESFVQTTITTNNNNNNNNNNNTTTTESSQAIICAWVTM